MRSEIFPLRGRSKGMALGKYTMVYLLAVHQY